VAESNRFYRLRRPHWREQESTYFVTWRLAKSQVGLSSRERTEVVSAIKHFDGSRYELCAYVVMDDHVHVIVRPLFENQLESVVSS
jgi:putative transposase